MLPLRDSFSTDRSRSGVPEIVVYQPDRTRNVIQRIQNARKHDDIPINFIRREYDPRVPCQIVIMELESIEGSLLQFQMSQVSFADLHRGRLSREQAISNLSRHLAKDRISESFLPSFVRNFETEKIGDKSQAEGNYLLTTEFAGIDVQLLP